MERLSKKQDLCVIGSKATLLNDLEIPVRKRLINECCQSLLEVIDLFGVQQIVCLGRFVEAQVKALVKNRQIDDVKVHFLVHPVPPAPWQTLAGTRLLGKHLSVSDSWKHSQMIFDQMQDL